MVKHYPTTVSEEPKAAKPVLAFRYVCHGCTKPAVYAVEPHTGSVTCPHCGTNQVCALENWIALTDAEKAEVN